MQRYDASSQAKGGAETAQLPQKPQTASSQTSQQSLGHVALRKPGEGLAIGPRGSQQGSQELKGIGVSQMPAQDKSGKMPGVSAKSPKESQKSPAGQLVRNRVEFNPLL